MKNKINLSKLSNKKKNQEAHGTHYLSGNTRCDIVASWSSVLFLTIIYNLEKLLILFAKNKFL